MYAFIRVLRVRCPCRRFYLNYSDKTEKRQFVPNSKTKIISGSRKKKVTIDERIISAQANTNIVNNIKPFVENYSYDLKEENTALNCENISIFTQKNNTEFVKENETNESQETSPEYRHNEINVQMVSKNIYEHIFANVQESSKGNSEIASHCHHALRHHGLDIDDCPKIEDVVLKLPELQGKDILEHFYTIGEQQSGPYRQLIEKIIKDDIPPLPEKWVFEPGWHQYQQDGSSKPVPYPSEDTLIFDVEVCMSAGQHPTLACAVSPTHWYGWVSQGLIEGSAKPRDVVYCSLDELIPLESLPSSRGYRLEDDILKPKLVIGHNVSYDRARIKEQYWMERTGTRFLDTMSMHVCISGVTSYQRAILKSKNREIDLEDENWMQISSLNSLTEVHKLYCGEEISKTSRDTFVDGTLDDVRNDFQNLMMYCAGDVIATSSVLRKMYPMFKERFPHPVTLAGILEIGTAYLPVNSNWLQYINTADLTYEDVDLECKMLLAKKADMACSLMEDEAYKKDLWMWDQDWSVQKLSLKSIIIKAKNKKKSAEDQENSKTVDNTADKIEQEVDPSTLNENIRSGIDYTGRFIMYENPKEKKEESTEEERSKHNDEEEIPDPLEKKFDYLFKKTLPSRRPFLPGYPAWYRKLCYKPDKLTGDWIPGPHNISTSMQITPKLLSLSWEGYPLHFIRGQGWGFLVPFRKDKPEEEDSLTSLENEENIGDNVPFETLVERCSVIDPNDLAANAEQSQAVLNTLWKDVESEISKRDFYSKKKKNKTDSVYKGTGVWSGVILGGTCVFMKLPHKDGPSKNVGNPLAKDFINKFSENVLSGEGKLAEKVLTAARMLSYWRNNRDRIREQKVVWLDDKDLPTKLRNKDKKYGAILPQVVVCGTLTRRAVEPTWMTASNAHKERIGSELRSMVQTPPGYSFVGADVDSQELWIAAILGDSQFGIHGATPFGWMTLSGSKVSGTDMHSHTAKAAQITRDHAKVLNYARIYGAGQNFAEKLLKQFNPAISDWEAKSRALKMFATTKGRRYYRLKPEYVERVYGEEHLDSPEQPLRMLGYQAMKIAKINGKLLDEMFEKPKWVGGTESHMFNRLEEIAGSEQPRTPFLSCQLTRALMTDGEMRKRHLPTAINWVVQSGAVDFLHLMLVNMTWLTGSKARFCLSFHDEVRYMVADQYKYEMALALHITNLYTRAFCAKKLGFNDLPQSVAFFSSVDVDTSLRKEAHLECVTPSNPHGLSIGYGTPPGESLDIHKTLEKCPNGLGKLYQGEEQKFKKTKN